MRAHAREALPQRPEVRSLRRKRRDDLITAWIGDGARAHRGSG
jgi:hypothetical protein